MVPVTREGNGNTGTEKMAMYLIQILKTIAFLLILLSFFFHSKDKTGKGTQPSEVESHPAEIYNEGDTCCGIRLSDGCSKRPGSEGTKKPDVLPVSKSLTFQKRNRN